MFRTPATVVVAFALSACTAPVVPEDDTASETGELEETDPTIDVLPEDPPVITVTLSFVPSPEGVTYARQDEPANLGGIEIAVEPFGTRVAFEYLAPKLGLAIEEWSEIPSVFSTDPIVSGRDHLVGDCVLKEPSGFDYAGPVGIDEWELGFEDGFYVYGGAQITFSVFCTPPDGTNPDPLALGIELPLEEDGDVVAYGEGKENEPLEVRYEYGNRNGFPYPSSYVLLPYDLGWPNEPVP